jgi:hypothetical protein
MKGLPALASQKLEIRVAIVEHQSPPAETERLALL